MSNVRELKQGLLAQIRAVTSEVYGRDLGEEFFSLTYPPEPQLGDFAVSCFLLARELGEAPAFIAQAVAERLMTNDYSLSVQASGPYINLKLPNCVIFNAVTGDDVSESLNLGAGERVMVEYLSPNTNKPLHLGHMRNGMIGMAVGNILKATGHEVILANLINDRGVHICKSMWAYRNHGQGQTPATAGVKGDHFVGQMYVLFSQMAKDNESLEDEVQQMLHEWEAGDQEVVGLWRMMNEWVYEGFATTYATLGFRFDQFYYESETYQLGKDIVADGLARGILINDEGQVLAEVPAETYERRRGQKQKTSPNKKDPKKITLLRRNGTSLYMTQDLGTAVRKFEEHGLSRSIYVVGREQDFHFNSLFSILGQLGYEWATRCYHLSYGMVYLPEGKMKSREGTVVDADHLVDDMTVLARREIEVRVQGLSENELATRARSIALAAIKFYLLRQNPHLDIHFDPKESISFEGVTGPYCQYAYARAKSILRKADMAINTQSIDFSILGSDEERAVANQLMEYGDVLTRAAKEYNPAIICGWLYETAKAFNQFYHTSRVVGVDVSLALSTARLALVCSVASALRCGLELLGIEAIEEM